MEYAGMIIGITFAAAIIGFAVYINMKNSADNGDPVENPETKPTVEVTETKPTVEVTETKPTVEVTETTDLVDKIIDAVNAKENYEQRRIQQEKHDLQTRLTNFLNSEEFKRRLINCFHKDDAGYDGNLGSIVVSGNTLQFYIDGEVMFGHICSTGAFNSFRVTIDTIDEFLTRNGIHLSYGCVKPDYSIKYSLYVHLPQCK